MSKKPDDAARVAGLASILQSSNKPKEALASPPPAPPLSPPPEVATPLPRRAATRKIGKSSDPNYHHYGFYLRTATHKQVKRRLEDTQPGKDVSDLMQELLEQWLTSI